MIGKEYTVQLKESAKRDVKEFEDFLLDDCFAPLTAKRQFEDLYNRLNWLKQFAELPAIDFNLSYQYGIIVRTIPYGKKMTIVYTVEDDLVYILRIMPQSMIIF